MAGWRALPKAVAAAALVAGMLAAPGALAAEECPGSCNAICTECCTAWEIRAICSNGKAIGSEGRYEKWADAQRDADYANDMSGNCTQGYGACRGPLVCASGETAVWAARCPTQARTRAPLEALKQKKQAEEKARKQAEADARKAQAEARKKEAEAGKAEAAARKKAEAEARKAEADSRKQAQADARLAEAEARKAADAERKKQTGGKPPAERKTAVESTPTVDAAALLSSIESRLVGASGAIEGPSRDLRAAMLFPALSASDRKRAGDIDRIVSALVERADKAIKQLAALKARDPARAVAELRALDKDVAILDQLATKARDQVKGFLDTVPGAMASVKAGPLVPVCQVELVNGGDGAVTAVIDGGRSVALPARVRLSSAVHRFELRSGTQVKSSGSQLVVCGRVDRITLGQGGGK